MIEGVIVMPVMILILGGTMFLSRGYAKQIQTMNEVRGEALVRGASSCKTGAPGSNSGISIGGSTAAGDDRSSTSESLQIAIEGNGEAVGEKGIRTAVNELPGYGSNPGSFRSLGQEGQSGTVYGAVSSYLESLYGGRYRATGSASVPGGGIAASLLPASAQTAYQLDVPCNEEPKSIDDMMNAVDWGITQSGLLDE